MYGVCLKVKKKRKDKKIIITNENDHKFTSAGPFCRMMKILEMQWLAESPWEVVVAMRLKKLNTRKRKSLIA